MLDTRPRTRPPAPHPINQHTLYVTGPSAAVRPTSVEAADDRDVEGFDDWAAARREQLAAGELTYVAHQYDPLYRAPGT